MLIRFVLKLVMYPLQIPVEMRIGLAIISGHTLELVEVLFGVLCIILVTILPWIGIKNLMLVMAHFDAVGSP